MPTDSDELELPIDGRIARRQRNIDAVLDVVLELFGEESLFPTIEQAALRSGLSLRSLYRYFADPGELLEAAIKRSRQQGIELSRIHAIGQGSLDRRLDDLVTVRLQLYEALAPVYRATVANAIRHPRVGDELAANRDALRAQFELQFRSELAQRPLAEREPALAAGDLITQLDSIDHLRRHRQMSVAETKVVLISALRSLLGQQVGT